MKLWIAIAVPVLLVSNPAVASEASQALQSSSQADINSSQATHQKDMDMLMSRIDRNADGKLSKAEARGTPFEAEFLAIDQNKDGQLDSDELAREFGSTAAGQPSREEGVEAGPKDGLYSRDGY